MNKYLVLLIFGMFRLSTAEAQLSHFVSYTTIPYVIFFNKENDAINKTNMSQALHNPNISYSVFGKKFGIEVYFNNPDRFYYNLFYYPTGLPPDTSISSITSFNLGANLHYKLLEQPFLNISFFSESVIIILIVGCIIENMNLANTK